MSKIVKFSIYKLITKLLRNQFRKYIIKL